MVSRLKLTLLALFIVPNAVISQTTFKAPERSNWYFDFTMGSNVHFSFDSIHNKFPNGVHTEAHSSLLNELDIGYRFKKSFSLGLGLEFNNLVDVQYVMDFKWSFMREKQMQPYTYLCLHGGITDIMIMSLHAGFGFDYYVGDRSYFIVDARLGPSWGSAEDPTDPITGDPNIEFHMESALSFGFGILFGKNTTKKSGD